MQKAESIRRYSLVLLLLARSASATELTVDQLSQWLCHNAIEDPEQLLLAFPARENAKVTKYSEAAPDGRSTEWTWVVRAPEFMVTHSCSIDPGETECWAYSLAVVARSSKKTTLFTSDQQAREWLSTIGTPCSSPGIGAGGSHVIEVCGPFVARVKRDIWRIQVKSKAQSVRFWWHPTAFPRQRFCSR